MCAETLWYVAYGSNLSAGRLQRYLDQTSPVAAPLDRRPMVLEHRLFFAEWSVGWGGGCAFIDPRPSSGVETRVTAWRLRADQFLGILARENGGAAVPDDFAPEAVGAGDRCMVVDGRYGLVIGVSVARWPTEPHLHHPGRPATDRVRTVGFVPRRPSPTD